MKIAKIVPIHKAKAKNYFNNYRPISLLPTFSKILEKIIFNRLSSFFNKNNILYKSQLGFQKGHSTEHALLEVQNRIMS